MPSAPAPRRGNWKLAYADFLTALVALFLVLWLVSDVPPEGRAELAGYFRGESDGILPVSSGSGPERAARFAETLRETRALVGEDSRLKIVAQGDQVRIEVLDRLSDPLFVSGGAALSDSGAGLLADLAALLSPTDWSLAIEGHTDAFPANGSGPDNWTLSSLRADAARSILEASGLDGERIIAVTGLASSVPLVPEEPHLAANRRVSLVLQAAQ